jgi:2,3-bisphosphoglycerate-dependent phosphoglycerate mutase
VVSAATVLHLVRHGESTWNLARRVQGQSPAAGALTPLGRAQAAAAAELLAELAPHARLVVFSDLPRARETALIVAGGLGLPMRCDPGLRELSFGRLEGLHLDDGVTEGTVQDAVDRVWREPRRPAPGGESVLDLHRRVHATLSRLAADLGDREAVLVTHGGPIRVATADSIDDVRHRPVSNASVTQLSVAAPAMPAWRWRHAS